jgi:hypothetical protein
MYLIDYNKYSLTDIIAKAGGLWKVVTSCFFLFSGLIFNIFLGDLINHTQADN